ncbi:hypothetical protein [Histidinibacterium lentulum]|uniref:Uncharacterized protein n=1 Tax=Histidinibacterium lentulum TaxID=2480588 RepID=A0A3N2QYC2_9RHOB|nr:hypothetical protein [Histidinibacterium lentulum]ROU00205.1 hypothetical protein EAT49_12950 [Histidinibacterium lentulum]
MRDEFDPKGLVAEAYLIEGIGTGECRSIFLDWALSLPAESDSRVAIATLLERHGVEGHPMTGVLREGLAAPARRGRRGGARGRRG